MVEFIETRKPNLIQIPKRVHPSKDNVILTDLFKDRDYSLRVALCTQRGCRNSAWEFVPKQAVPGKTILLTQPIKEHSCRISYVTEDAKASTLRD